MPGTRPTFSRGWVGLASNGRAVHSFVRQKHSRREPNATAATETVAVVEPKALPEHANNAPTRMCRVRNCAGAALRQRSALRTITLPGTPREARSWTALPAQREAAARASSVVANFPAPLIDHAARATLGRRRRPRRPGFRETGVGTGAAALSGNRDGESDSEARL